MLEKARPALRLLAYLVDMLLIFLVYVLTAWHVSGATDIPELFNRLLLVFILMPVGLVVFVPLYFLYTTSRWGGTVGKLLTGIEVVDEQGKHISLKRAFFRNYVGYTVSSLFFYLGFVWVAIDTERRGWHDMIANTSVVIKKRGGAIFGLICLVLLAFTNIIVGYQIIQRFQLNRSMYLEIGQEIVTEIQKRNEKDNLPQPETSPVASSTTPVSELTFKEAESLSRAYNTFGINFLKNRFAAEVNKNIFISPISLEMAFSMAMMGASPDVQQEMVKTLGFRMENNETIKTLSQKYLAKVTAPDKDVTISIANSIWTQTTAKVNPEFLAVNKDAFQAHIESLNLTTIEGIAQVNNWVSEQTHGKISEVLTNPLRLDQIMALVNAVYFKGNWTAPFDKSKTKDQEFTAGDGAVSKTAFMEQSAEFQYLENPQFQAVQIPYGAEEKWRMYLFLPKSNMTALFNSLTLPNWQKWQAEFSSRQGTVFLPKFKLEYEADLSNIMNQLGMKLAFMEGDRFPRIAPLVWIEKGIHKTYVDVNEEGTEAAAVTALIPKAGGGSEPEPPFIMNLNHPFLYAIVDVKTDVIVFMGVLQKPE